MSLGMDGLGEPAAFDLAEMLADCIDFINISAAGQKELIDLLLFLQGNPGHWKGHQRGTAPGNTAEDNVARAGMVRESECFPGRLKSGLIGDRMTGMK